MKSTLPPEEKYKWILRPDQWAGEEEGWWAKKKKTDKPICPVIDHNCLVSRRRQMR